jgi:hypothetical protein
MQNKASLVCSQEDWKDVLFGIHWHSKGVLHATSRRSLFHQCDSRALLHLRTFVIWGHCRTLAHSCTNVTKGHCCTSVMVGQGALMSNMFQQWPLFPLLCNTDPLVMQVAYPIRKMWQTYMDKPIMCSSLTLEHEEHLKTHHQSLSWARSN